ncbi:MAG: hypothetical protein ACHQEM_12085 [Chitinophagales bacterium]
MRKSKLAIIAVLFTLLLVGSSFGQATKNKLMLGLGYFNDKDYVQYLKATTKTKVNGKFQQVPGIHLSFYISSEDTVNLLGRAVTNDKGFAVLFIPPSARQVWKSSSKQSFIVVSDSTVSFDPVHSTIDLTKARIQIDTLADRKITATLLALSDSVWKPVKGVDMRITIKRLGGDLNVNETPTYTTDSLGQVSADFKLANLPGDTAGNLAIVAIVDDNDTYGNLAIERKVPWGIATKYTAAFDTRSLFARRGYSPLWLEWMAYSIIVAVWGVLLYLFMQIRKLRKLGKPQA